MQDEKLLRESPIETAENSQGGRFIPIEILENCLDNFRSATKNYTSNLYKDGYANLCVYASIELELNIIADDGTEYKRTFVGACNFPLQSIAPIPDWNATAKSMCIKNAASDAGKYLGRGLNADVIPDRSERVIQRQSVKKKPDSKILQQFADAIKKGDKATETMLSNIYDIKTEQDAEEK